MAINLTPAMTRILVRAGAFSRAPLVLLDIGARGGIKDHWRVFGDDLRLVGFEPDPEEFQRLQQADQLHGKVFPFGLGGRNETRILHIHDNAPGSSLYLDDPAFMKRMLAHEARRHVKEQPIELRRLDDIVAEIGDVDFVDIDTEGAELEIMQAGTHVVGRMETLGVFAEARFMEGFNTPLFWQMDQFLRGLGFSFYNLYTARESRRALPFPMLGDQRDERNPDKRIFGPTKGGQLAYADALYLRDAVGHRSSLPAIKLLKLACFFEIFEQNDSAAELIIANRSTFDEVCDHRALLDALVPVVGGRKLSYDEYISRFFQYDLMLRSVPPEPKRDIYGAARELALQLIHSPRGRRVAGTIARIFLARAQRRRAAPE